MIPGPLMEIVDLLLIAVTASAALLVFLYRQFKLEGEALDDIGRFIRENPQLIRRDDLFELFVIVSYVRNSFGMTRAHYTRLVEDVKGFITQSAMETR